MSQWYLTFISVNPHYTILANVVLKEDTEVLEEVVVVGYGAQKKETLTGAVTVVTDKMIQGKGSCWNNVLHESVYFR